MKLPNGFGSVHKLSGKRRKPFIAQKTAGWEIDEKTGKAKQKYKIIGYYETRQAALIALSDFNAHPYNIDAAKITFAELFDKFMIQPHIEKLSRSRACLKIHSRHLHAPLRGIFGPNLPQSGTHS